MRGDVRTSTRVGRLAEKHCGDVERRVGGGEDGCEEVWSIGRGKTDSEMASAHGYVRLSIPGVCGRATVGFVEKQWRNSGQPVENVDVLKMLSERERGGGSLHVTAPPRHNPIEKR